MFFFRIGWTNLIDYFIIHVCLNLIKTKRSLLNMMAVRNAYFAFFFHRIILIDCNWNRRKSIKKIIIFIDNLPKWISNSLAQTSTNASSSSFITQWYWYCSISVQLWVRACSSQFFPSALFVISIRDSGQESTISAVLFGKKQDLLSLIYHKKKGY